MTMLHVDPRFRGTPPLVQGVTTLWRECREGQRVRDRMTKTEGVIASIAVNSAGGGASVLCADGHHAHVGFGDGATVEVMP